MAWSCSDADFAASYRFLERYEREVKYRLTKAATEGRDRELLEFDTLHEMRIAAAVLRLKCFTANELHCYDCYISCACVKKTLEVSWLHDVTVVMTNPSAKSQQ